MMMLLRRYTGLFIGFGGNWRMHVKTVRGECNLRDCRSIIKLKLRIHVRCFMVTLS